MTAITEKELASRIDHTYLKAMATEDIIRKLCQEAASIGAASVAVNTAWTGFAARELENTDVKVTAVIAFPLGQTGLEIKLAECEKAIGLGGGEVDYVLDVGRVHMGDWAYIRKEMEELTALCHKNDVALKVILETCYLDREQIRKVCEIAKETGIDFVKTSTGFGTGGATAEDVRLMKDTVGDTVQVKASGGIRNLDDALTMLEAGADRLGMSASLEVLEELRAQQK